MQHVGSTFNSLFKKKKKRHTLNSQRVPRVMRFGPFMVGVEMDSVKWIPCDSS